VAIVNVGKSKALGKPSESRAGTGSGNSKAKGDSKVASPTTTSVKFDPSGVTVKKINPDGSVVISVIAQVDPVTALRSGNNVLDVKLVTPEKPAQVLKQDPLSVINSILNSNATSRQITEQQADAVIKQSKMDITATISNSDASSLVKSSVEDSKSQLGVERVVQAQLLPDALAADARSSGPLTYADADGNSKRKVGQDIPVLDTPTSTAKMFETRADATPKQLAVDMLFKDGLPPSTSSKLFSPVQEASDVLAGVNSSARRGNDFTKQENLTATDVRENALAGSILRGVNEDVLKASDLPKDAEATVVTVVEQPVETVDVKTEIILTKDDLLNVGSDVGVMIEPASGLAGSFKPVGCKVDLTDRILEHMSKLGSVIETRDGRGVLFDSKITFPTDKANARGTTRSSGRENAPQESTGKGDDGIPADVELYTKVYSPLLPLDASVWEKMDDSTSKTTSTDVRKAMGPASLRYVDRGHSPTRPGFVEILNSPVTRHITSATPLLGHAVAEVDNRFVSVTAFIRRGAVTVRLAGFQSSYSVTVVRRDLTVREKNFQIVDVPEPYAIVNDESSPVTFVDSAVTENHIYEYKAKLLTRAGREILSPSSALIKYRAISDNAVKLIMSDPVVTTDVSGDVDVTFDIEVDTSETNVSLVANFMKQIGFDNLFSNDLEANRERLKNVTSFAIERTDMTMGEVETFPIFLGGRFSDKENRATSNVSPLKVGREYRYVISVLARDADSLVPSVIRPRKDSKTGNVYDVRPFRSYSPSVMRTGTLKADSRYASVNVDDEMLDGFTGTQVHVDVSVKLPRPKVVGGNVVRTYTGAVDIRWKIDGEPSQVDHFVLVCYKSGMRSIVGRTHTFTGNESFMFRDDVIAMTPGDIDYYVTPIYIDMKMGDEFWIGKARSLNSRKKV
jgi:hypothetical protein